MSASVSRAPSSSDRDADFRHRFATSRQVRVDRFERALFFDCAPLHALFVSLVVEHPFAAFFAADHELLSRVATACRLQEVREAIGDFRRHPANARWLRRVACVRISTHRLERIARDCLTSDA